MELFGEFDRSLMKGCPLQGPLEMRNWEFNEHIPELLPSIVPAGDFMFQHQMHDSRNPTYIEYKFFFVVKAIGVMDLSISKVG